MHWAPLGSMGEEDRNWAPTERQENRKSKGICYIQQIYVGIKGKNFEEGI
jgi:hypothetical protein